MINLHPFQIIFFNSLLSAQEPEYISTKWSYGAWGTSGKQALEYILKHDQSSKIKVDSLNLPLINAVLLLSPNDRKRIKLTSNENEIDYFVAGTTINPNDTRYKYLFKHYQTITPFHWYSIQRNNNTITSIFNKYKKIVITKP